MFQRTHNSFFARLVSAALFLFVWGAHAEFDALTSLGQEVGERLESRVIAVLKDHEINESSGLILSQQNPDCFWTHNDSGDLPRLFLIHRDGRTIARVKIDGAMAIDWEDITMATINGSPKLIIGDIGGNTQKREHVTLYIIPELNFPFDAKRPLAPIESSASIEATIEVTFVGGVTNYEGLAVDANAKSIVIFEKALLGARVYSLPFPSLSKEKLKVQATEIGQTSVPYACACDISKDSRSMVVTNYLVGFLFTRRTLANGSLEEWSETLQRVPTSFPLPKLRQTEAVCFSADGKSIFLSSEHTPTPLVELKIPVSK
ncbi:MAG: hypothetical protein NTY15_19515 [Planctomycetota bacterium]|nr:hypothetical protein [Planctomycetota bacterium]